MYILLRNRMIASLDAGLSVPFHFFCRFFFLFQFSKNRFYLCYLMATLWKRRLELLESSLRNSFWNLLEPLGTFLRGRLPATCEKSESAPRFDALHGVPLQEPSFVRCELPLPNALESVSNATTVFDVSQSCRCPPTLSDGVFVDDDVRFTDFTDLTMLRTNLSECLPICLRSQCNHPPALIVAMNCLLFQTKKHPLDCSASQDNASYRRSTQSTKRHRWPFLLLKTESENASRRHTETYWNPKLRWSDCRWWCESSLSREEIACMQRLQTAAVEAMFEWARIHCKWIRNPRDTRVLYCLVTTQKEAHPERCLIRYKNCEKKKNTMPSPGICIFRIVSGRSADSLSSLLFPKINFHFILCRFSVASYQRNTPLLVWRSIVVVLPTSTVAGCRFVQLKTKCWSHWKIHLVPVSDNASSYSSRRIKFACLHSFQTCWSWID